MIQDDTDSTLNDFAALDSLCSSDLSNFTHSSLLSSDDFSAGQPLRNPETQTPMSAHS